MVDRFRVRSQSAPYVWAGLFFIAGQKDRWCLTRLEVLMGLMRCIHGGMIDGRCAMFGPLKWRREKTWAIMLSHSGSIPFV